MKPLSRADLWSLEDYADRRVAFRQEVMAHKKNRQVALGEHARLYFEDRLTIQYQVQEMLRVERIFEGAAIQEELDAYNPLIPDGQNWKATFMLEYEDVAERRKATATLVGIEDHLWVRVAGFEPVYAIADEDMDRDSADRTSTVHFVRFELTSPMIAALKEGAVLAMGIDHPACPLETATIPLAVRRSLIEDLEL
ncbi:DUF3501 family protein [Mangrovitalea sediminis]|uniref:DUF3501 family protein n=1 Tax=Mangrovitalea sediminis TaxID=1982043 RepID=UPI000BE57D28|nr:DUF3501 family protein [Mangrovitalea sediminis]